MAALLSLKQVLVCVNKMDMVEFSEEVYSNIKEEYLTLGQKLGLKNIDFIPVSALKGDNIVNTSHRMPWYTGPSLLDYLENIQWEEQDENKPWRFPVQWVIRPQTEDLPDYRGYAGRVIGHGLKLGEEVLVLPSGVRSKIAKIEWNESSLEQAEDGQSVVLHLTDDIDISRGDFLVQATQPAEALRNLEGDVAWFDQRPLDTAQIYLLQNHSKLTKIKVSEVEYKYDINTQERIFGEDLHLNDIGKIRIKAAEEVVFDKRDEYPQNSRAILIDPRTNLTVGALILTGEA